MLKMIEPLPRRVAKSRPARCNASEDRVLPTDNTVHESAKSVEVNK